MWSPHPNVALGQTVINGRGCFGRVDPGYQTRHPTPMRYHGRRCYRLWVQQLAKVDAYYQHRRQGSSRQQAL